MTNLPSKFISKIKLHIIKNKWILLYLAIVSAFTITLTKFTQFNTETNFLIKYFIQELLIITPAILVYKISNAKFVSTERSIRKINIKSFLLVIYSYLYFFQLAITVGIFSLITKIQIPGFSEQQNILAFFEGYPFLTIFLLVAIIPPIIEEMTFRGILFKIVDGSNLYKIISTSLIFALLHLQMKVVIPLFILGIILGNLRVKTNSIIYPILFHIVNNSIALIINQFIR